MLVLDHCIFSLQTAGGISSWWAEHTRLACQRYGDRVCHKGLYANNNLYLKAEEIVPAEQPRAGRLPLLWPFQPVDLPPQATVFHSSYLRFCNRRANAATVFTFHDDIWLSHRSPAAMLKANRTANCLAKATLIHCISSFSKRVLLERYPWVPESRIRVVYHGFSPAPPANPINQISRLSGPYALWVGNRHFYKNGFITIGALGKLPGINLVLVGGEPLSAKERNEIARLKLHDRIHSLTRVSSSELTWLYQNAVALWYTSLNEGFGMPVIEAAAQRCPVLASAGHSVEEIGRGWPIVSANPTSSWLAKETERLLSSETLRKKLGDEGPALARYYSWDRYSDGITSVYEELGLC